MGDGAALSDRPKVRIRELEKSFGALQVLRGFSLDVEQGETVAVIGRSGSGKSVLLKHVAGLLRPDEGTVEVDGEDLTAADRDELNRMRLRIGYVFQFAGLFDSMTVADNIRMALRKRDYPRDRMDARVSECLEQVELAGIEGKYPAELSGGMRKRVGLARAVAGEPELLLFDEPTTGLDPVTTALIDGLTLRLKAELGATGIMVTHAMESAYRVADRIVMLFDGRAHAVGTPEEIRRSDDPVVRSFVEGRTDLWPRESGGAEVGT